MVYIPFLLMLAVLPVFALMLFVYIQAGKRKISIKLVIFLGVMGGISTIPAAVLEYVGDIWLQQQHMSENMKLLIEFFLIVGVVEELGKYLFLIFLTWKHPNFQHSYSAIVYSVSASLGFALVENILYVLLGGASVGIVRAFTAVPLHCMVAVVMGFLYAVGREAAYQKRVGKCILFMVLAYVIPIVVHGFYDYIATKASERIVYFGVFGLMVLIILASGLILMVYAAKKNHRLDGTFEPLYQNIPEVSPYFYSPMPYGGMQPYGNMPMYGGMQPYGNMPMYGGMQPYGGMPMYGGMQPYGNMPMYGGMQPYGNMPMYGGMQNFGWDHRYIPAVSDYYAATEYTNGAMNVDIYNAQDEMYPEYNVWQGAMLPEDPEMLYAPGKKLSNDN